MAYVFKAKIKGYDVQYLSAEVLAHLYSRKMIEWHVEADEEYAEYLKGK